MKLRKNVQRVLEIILATAIILLFTTIESEWCFEYLVFFVTNLAIAFGTGLILSKFGRYEE